MEPIYDAAFPFRGEYAVVRQGEKRGFLRLDPQGGISVFIAPQYDDVFRFTEGLAPVKIGKSWGYVSDGQPWQDLVEAGVVEIKPRCYGGLFRVWDWLSIKRDATITRS